MNILAISCHYHDSAACLIRDGKIAAAAQEERFNRIKGCPDFPLRAANYCLQAGGCTAFDLDYVCFYEKPFLKFARMLFTHLRAYPRSWRGFSDSLPLWLSGRLNFARAIRDDFGFNGDILYIKHHLSHAASAFLASPFEESAILTTDSVGEEATMARGSGSGNRIRISRELRFPDSLGLLYTAVTTYLGFAANEGEGTVMGLAACGKPAFLEKMREAVVLKPDGSLRLNPDFFDFTGSGPMYGPRFTKLFGPARLPEEPVDQRHGDMAATLQKLTEDVILAAARDLHRETKSRNLSLAGGVFLNCVANHKILEETEFENVFIQPAAGDAGGALGAACYAYFSLLGNARTPCMPDAYLGPEYSPSVLRRALLKESLDFKELPDDELPRFTAQRLAEGKIIGWFQGRMEFGPRALGNRSILADPRDPDMKDLLNRKVKKREPFRPYAPAVLDEAAHEYFHLRGKSPFMLLAARVREDKKSLIPAVTHVDGTARIQTVSKDANPRFWSLIKAFGDLTGVPMVINTSFNLRGEPIACSPEDAISGYRRSGMDCLVLGNYFVERKAG